MDGLCELDHSSIVLFHLVGYCIKFLFQLIHCPILCICHFAEGLSEFLVQLDDCLHFLGRLDGDFYLFALFLSLFREE